MFLERTLARNRPLVDFAIDAIRRGSIPPATLLLDLETVEANAALLRSAADASGVELLFMAKQVGRHPDFLRVVARHIPAAVAVDLADARALAAAGVRIGHLGHLVQPGFGEVPAALRLEPRLVTTYSVAMLRRIASVAEERGYVQRVLVRVRAPGDVFHPGQEGGVGLDELPTLVECARGLAGVDIVGVTSYPCLEVIDGRAIPTPNLETLRRAARLLASGSILNAPGHTCVATLPVLGAAGVTQAEPGHALTGTTPLHAADGSPERPAAVFATQVAHRLDRAHVAVWGGGFYARAKARAALVVSADRDFVAELVPHPPDAIDYYVAVRDDGLATEGDPVVCAFRFQAFVTRSPIAAVADLAGRPRITSVADPFGNVLA